MHSDSKVVLGYLHNKDRRFSKYVKRRIKIILTHLNKLVLKMWKQININNKHRVRMSNTYINKNILTYQNLYCTLTTDFSGVVGRVVESTAPELS